MSKRQHKVKDSHDLMLSLTDPEMDNEPESSPNTVRIRKEISGIPAPPARRTRDATLDGKFEGKDPSSTHSLPKSPPTSHDTQTTTASSSRHSYPSTLIASLDSGGSRHKSRQRLHHDQQQHQPAASVSIQTDNQWPEAPIQPHLGTGLPPPMDYVPQQFQGAPGAQFPIPPPPSGSWTGGGSVGVVGPIPGLPSPGSDYYPNVQMIRYPIPPGLHGPHPHNYQRQGGSPLSMPLMMQYGSNRSLDQFSPSPPSTTASEIGAKKKSKNPFVRMSHKVQKTVGLRPRRASSLPAELDTRRMMYPDSMSSVAPSIERSTTPELSRYPTAAPYSSNISGPKITDSQLGSKDKNWSPTDSPTTDRRNREIEREDERPGNSSSAHPATGVPGGQSVQDPGTGAGGSKTKFVPNQDLYRITEQSTESDAYPMVVAADVHSDHKDKKKKHRKHRSHGNISHTSADRRKRHKLVVRSNGDFYEDAPLISKENENDGRGPDYGSKSRLTGAVPGSSSEERKVEEQLNVGELRKENQKVPLWKRYGTFGVTDEIAKDNRQQVLEIFGAGISRAKKVWTLAISLVSIFCLALYFSIFTKQFTLKDQEQTFPQFTHTVSFVLLSSFGIVLSPLLACEIRRIALRFQMISGLSVMGVAAILTGITLKFAFKSEILLVSSMLFLGAMAGLGAAMVLPSAWCGTLYAVSMFTERMMIAAITLSLAMSCFFGPMISHFATTGSQLSVPYFVLGTLLMLLALACLLLFHPLKHLQEYRLASSVTFRALLRMARFWILLGMVAVASSCTVFYYLHLWHRFRLVTLTTYIVVTVLVILFLIAVCSAFWVGYFPKTSNILLGTILDALLGFFLIGPFPHIGISSASMGAFIAGAVFLALGILPQYVICCRQLFLFVWCQDYSQEIDSISMAAGFLASGTFIGILVGGAAGAAAMQTIGYNWMSAVLFFAQLLQIALFVLFKCLPTASRSPTRGMLGLKSPVQNTEAGQGSPLLQKRSKPPSSTPFDRVVERLSGRRGRQRVKKSPHEKYPYQEIGRSGL